MNTQPINTPDRARGDEPAELDPGMVEKARAAFEAMTKAMLDAGRRYEEWMNAATTAALSAAGVPALTAEVERLRYDLDHSYSQREWSALTARATSAEQERDEFERRYATVLRNLNVAQQERDRLRADAVEVARALLDERGQVAAEPAAHRILAGSGEQPAPTALVRVEWGVVLDDLGSTDVYDTREEAEARAVRDSTVVRIETWRVGSGGQPGEDDRHPEAYCHRCGGPNITWWAPSPVWNYVMGYPDEAHDGIVCPLCFAELAEAKGASEGWRVEPGRWPEGVSLVHTDGRVWDDRAGLWVDPAPVVPDGGHVLTEYGTTSCPVEIVRAEVVDGKCSACGAVVPDSPDVRERVRGVLTDAARRESFSGTDIDALTDAVLAVVGQGVTAETAWDEGYAAGLRDAPRGEPGGTPNPHRAVVRSGEQGGEDRG